MIKPIKLSYPELAAPKQGGLLDSIHQNRFIEWLSGDEIEYRRDRQIENQTDDMLCEKLERGEE